MDTPQAEQVKKGVCAEYAGKGSQNPGSELRFKQVSRDPCHENKQEDDGNEAVNRV